MRILEKLFGNKYPKMEKINNKEYIVLAERFAIAGVWKICVESPEMVSPGQILEFYPKAFFIAKEFNKA